MRLLFEDNFSAFSIKIFVVTPLSEPSHRDSSTYSKFLWRNKKYEKSSVNDHQIRIVSRPLATSDQMNV